jgi:hypothetical protein
MTEKNEALLLADALGNLEATGYSSDSVSLTDRSEAIADAAAAELRRLSAENERLAAEVANRNRRALAGDEAVAALANVHAHYEGLEAQRDALLEAAKEAEPMLQAMLDNIRKTLPQYTKMPALDKLSAAIKAVEEGK